ncbi:hypothetical protein A1O7_08906 [Cladophialophora yegresii CBS 114405]|uniref:G-patch domain-containing protein n=1 Tax=Cladophialophora yegresii CBS 114405 TaxID=1182544 RepID=W9VSJ4_9EURO|nr:uncharacterized protein A1O7_08906 [Cladophialophora yegresii CBS 114405]EXJ55975.1 hypothetical protein A1O7_08906 [Cladophialophora yegresii CBS 114405]
MPMPDSEAKDEDYFLPLQDQRVFGAGIKRKRINFVRASTAADTPPSTTSIVTTANAISSRYLSIVLPQSASHTQQDTKSKEPTTARGVESPERCPVCAERLATTPSTHEHESSLAHQVCLEHVRPPSHLPRSHVGLRYMSSYGWDPDARRGLGAREEGITAPIKATRKNDTAGLRERDDRNDDGSEHALSATTNTAKKKRLKGKETQDSPAAAVKSDAKQVRVREAEARKRAERLRANFYGPDLERYLGPEASTV